MTQLRTLLALPFALLAACSSNSDSSSAQTQPKADAGADAVTLDGATDSTAPDTSSGDSATPSDAQQSDSATDAAPQALCSQAKQPRCVDQMIQDLALHDDKTSDGTVVSTKDGDDWVTTVDASKGGSQGANQYPWVYVRFEEDGAKRVDIDDETALENMTWHIAARRFVLRVNGGPLAPSCVGVAPFLEKTYADLVSVPEGLTYYGDDYYTESCEFINDSSGLSGSPQAALAPWWKYSGCVQTTGKPFLIQLESGRVIKFVVESYYTTGQDGCNATGTMGQGSGNYKWRWRYLK